MSRILTFVFLFCLSNVVRANDLRFYDSKFNALHTVSSVGSGSSITGVCFDGFYYWVADDTNKTLEQIAIFNGTPYTVKTIALNSVVFTETKGVECMDDSLLVAVTRTIGASSSQIAIQLDKRTGEIKDLLTSAMTLANRTIQDICYDGNYTNVGSYNSSTGGATRIRLVHFATDTEINSHGVSGRPYGLACLNDLVIGNFNGTGAIYDYDGNVYYSTSGLGIDYGLKQVGSGSQVRVMKDWQGIFLVGGRR